MAPKPTVDFGADAAWQAYYDANPGAMRSVGAGGIEPVMKGRRGVTKSQAEARTQGETVTGGAVTFELPGGGRTRADTVTLTTAKELKVREAKEGPSARLTPRQQQMQQAVAQGQAVVPRGENARQAGLPPGQPIVVKHFEEDRY
jgi:hypothetical protein